MIEFLENCHADAILAASETTSKKNMKISKNHSKRMFEKFKASRENLDTYDEEPKVVGATSTITTSKSVPSKDH